MPLCSYVPNFQLLTRESNYNNLSASLWFEVSFDINVSSLLNIVLEKGNALCFLCVYLEHNGYDWKVALLTILLHAAVTGENKPQVVYSKSGPYVTFVYRLGGQRC